jgi:hypothetical protein
MLPHKPPATPNWGTLPDFFGPDQFAMMSPTSGAGIRPSAVSSSMTPKHWRALKRSHSQSTPPYPSGHASIRRYLCARSLARLPKNWTPSVPLCARTLTSRAQQPCRQPTTTSKNLEWQRASSSDTPATAVA